MTDQSNILEVKNVIKEYPIKGGFFHRVINKVQAVSDVSFILKKGETLGLVGESGCGKSTLGRALMGLETPTSGSVLFDNIDLVTMNNSELLKARKNFQIIFQDPFSSLNPKMTVYKLLEEPIKNFYPEISKNERIEQVKELMTDVGLRPEFAGRYPHEFSGGQRQRISIGRALASKPQLIICDEPVSALDVSIQAQILNLLMKLQKKYNFSYVFISHDLHVIRHISSRIAVMYLGRFVEVANSNAIYTNPLHPYSKALLSAVPSIADRKNKKRILLEGDVPSPINPPTGCRFHPRCPIATEKCAIETPTLENYGDNHFASCFNI